MPMPDSVAMQLPSFNARAELDALRRTLSGLFTSNAPEAPPNVAEEVQDQIKEQIPSVAERYLARIGDTLEVKGTSGKVWDIWRVLSSSATSGGGSVEVRSLRTGKSLKVSADIFELKKFKSGDAVRTLRPMPKKFFDVIKEKNGTWTIRNVPIMGAESRGKKLYDKKYLDEVVSTYWADKQEVLDQHGEGAEAHPYEPPVIIGHTSSDPEYRNDQREAVAYISAMWRSDKTLLANLGDIKPEWIDKLRKGALPNRSCELKVKNKRIVALALLSEEPYFKLPQMRNFSASEEDGYDVIRYTYEGDSSMQELDQLLQLFKQGASLLETMMQSGGGMGAPAMAGGAPPPPPSSPAPPMGGGGGAPPPGGGGAPGSPPNKQFDSKGGGKDPKNVEDENEDGGQGEQSTVVGEAGDKMVKTDPKGRPASTASSQKGKPDNKPDQPLSFSERELALLSKIEQLEAVTADMGKKMTFAVDTINTLSSEKRRLANKQRLVKLMNDGAPLGGAEGVENHLTVLSRMSVEEVEKHFEGLAKLPKINMRTRHSMSGASQDTELAEQMEKYSTDFDANPDRFNNTGYDRETFAASQVLGEMLGGGDFDTMDKEGEL